jgi:hypothetical protein
VATLQYEWSNRQVEWQINRLNLIKRQIYGRRALICCVNVSWEPPDAGLLHGKRESQRMGSGQSFLRFSSKCTSLQAWLA